MNRTQVFRLAFGLILVAALMVVVAGLDVKTDPQTVTPDVAFTLVLFAALFGAAGLVLYFIELLHVDLRKIKDEVASIEEALANDIQKVEHVVEDDVKKLGSFSFNRGHFMFVATLIATIIFVAYTSHYDEWGSTWGPFSVILIAAILSSVLFLFVRLTEWWTDHDWHTPNKVLIIPVVGLIICMGLGIYMTEPIEYGGLSAYQQENQQSPQTYDFSRTRIYPTYFYYFGSSSSSSSSATLGSSSVHVPTCSGKGCSGYLVLLLIALVIILIIGSAIIPHFWILAGIILLTIMVITTIRELRVQEDQITRYRYYDDYLSPNRRRHTRY